MVKHLLMLGTFLDREATRLLAPCGVNQQQFVVLKEIEEKGPLAQKDLCSALLFEKSNVSKIVAKLEAGRLVAVATAADDSRRSVLSVTKKGTAVICDAMRLLNEWNARWLAVLSSREVQQAVATLGKLNASAP